MIRERLSSRRPVDHGGGSRRDRRHPGAKSKTVPPGFDAHQPPVAKGQDVNELRRPAIVDPFCEVLLLEAAAPDKGSTPLIPIAGNVQRSTPGEVGSLGNEQVVIVEAGTIANEGMAIGAGVRVSDTETMPQTIRPLKQDISIVRNDKPRALGHVRRLAAAGPDHVAVLPEPHEPAVAAQTLEVCRFVFGRRKRNETEQSDAPPTDSRSFSTVARLHKNLGRGPARRREGNPCWRVSGSRRMQKRGAT